MLHLRGTRVVCPALPRSTPGSRSELPGDEQQYPGIGLDELAEGEVMWRADS
jgi:hypothetical protein